MIPPYGPQISNSQVAEPNVYWHLAKQLDDSFTVIHSLPWLNAAVKGLDKTFAPTGEIDFIIIHPSLGILVAEVKGGVFKFDRTRFTYVRTNEVFDPIGQLRRGVFTLSEWIKTCGVHIPLGYAWIFPNVDTKDKPLPIGMQDPSSPSGRPVIDYRDLPNIGSRVVEIMQYWKNTLNVKGLTVENIEKIIDLICPSTEYNLGWDARVEYDNKTWLTFNEQQVRNLKIIVDEERTVVSGRPGTGKTVLAIAMARFLAEQNKRVLFILHNRHITAKVRNELSDSSTVDVESFLGLCFRAARKMGYPVKEELTSDDFDEAHEFLEKAINAGRMNHYDALIVDEGQIIHREWYVVLRKWIRRVHVFCDETQAFPFEKKLTTRELEEQIIDAEHAGTLTINMRSPRSVFDRLDMSLPPVQYEQFSPRQFEQDTLQEIASLDPLSTLWGILKNDLQGVSPQNIGIITTKLRMKELESIGALETLKDMVALIDTSERVRGLEFPIVIVYDIGFTEKTLLLINAYARATTRVIGIYSIWSLKLFENPDIEKEAFIVEVLKNPEIAEAVKNPWTYILKKLGWELYSVVTLSGSIFWNVNLGVWVVHTDNPEYRLEEKMWIAHLLLKTDYPVYYIRSGPGYLHISENIISSKSLEEPITSTSIRIATCPDCGNLAVQKEEGNISCANCMPRKHPLPPVYTSLTECDRMISNPDKYTKDDKISMGLHLLSLCTLQKASPDLSQVIRHYVTGAGNQVGYQPLLIFVTTLIYNLDDQQTISLEGITNQIKKLVLPQNYHALDKIIPLTTNAWLKRGWIYKPSPDKKGFYAKSQKLPSLEKSAEDQSAEEK